MSKFSLVMPSSASPDDTVRPGREDLGDARRRIEVGQQREPVGWEIPRVSLAITVMLKSTSGVGAGGPGWTRVLLAVKVKPGARRRRCRRR